jgi:hypothetical protein
MNKIIFILILILILLKLYFKRVEHFIECDDIVFIITRYIKDETTNKYWYNCYSSIRKVYPNVKIIIIDDNSPYKNTNIDNKLVNCKIIKSEYPQRGELLPYYYFHKYKYAKKAIILHDSVFINREIDINNVNTYKFLWNFRHQHFDPDRDAYNIISKLNDSKLNSFYKDHTKWNGCFGSMSIITWNFLDKINTKYNFFDTMLSNIKNRHDRICFEQIFGCICTYIDKRRDTVFGDIHEWRHSIQNKGCKLQSNWHIRYDEYNKCNNIFNKEPIMKVWTGR